MTAPALQLPLALPAESPQLALLRQLCAGVHCHPCPGGVTEGYLAFACKRPIADDLRALWRRGLVVREVDDDDTSGALWRPA